MNIKRHASVVPVGVGAIAAWILVWLLVHSGTAVIAWPGGSEANRMDTLTPSHLSDATSIHYVALTGSDSGDCSTPVGACRTIQYAVDQATEGDEIRVAAGTYSDLSVRPRADVETTGVVTQVLYISKTVTIRGGYTTANDFGGAPDPAANPTILDAQGTGRALYITSGPSAGPGDTISPIIEGLRFTKGDATRLGGEPSEGKDAGGGVYAFRTAATISGNQVFSNAAAFGGGLFLNLSAANLDSNAIMSNTADLGGGLYLNESDARINGNTIVSNTADRLGGGLYLWFSIARLTNNTITHNTADSGGGLRLARSPAQLRNNILTLNSADDGGGIHFVSSDALLINNVITDNRADTSGSGMYIEASSPLLLHTTLARNSGGDGTGVYVTDRPGLQSAVTFTNTILVSHTVGIKVTGGNMVTIDAVLWHNAPITVSQEAAASLTAQNQYMGDPAFDPDGFHLTANSLAADKARFTSVSTDIDGDSRPDRCFPDLGADEYASGTPCNRIYLPLVARP